VCRAPPTWPTKAESGNRSRSSRDPAPLSARQVWALARCAARELTWGLPLVAREVRGWRSLARAIPDAAIREDALDALTRKRGQTDGAALLSTLTRVRNPRLLRLLVAYQIIWDFLDSVHERGATRGEQNGRQLHLALIDALDPTRTTGDYYLYHPWREDGGYLRSLVSACRECCAELPGYEHVRPLLLTEACHGQAVLSINHNLDPDARDGGLLAWSAAEFPEGHEACWWELSGAASAGLTIFALLALAAEPDCDDGEVHRTFHTYFPWVSAAATMLDSYVDCDEDTASGDHIYISHYPDRERAIGHIRSLIDRCLRESQALRNGETHTLIAASMIALYLSKDSARRPALRASTKALADAGGLLTRLLVPILRLWRIAYAQRET
jgi:tetraprenyl-beta-curcumene synthase